MVDAGNGGVSDNKTLHYTGSNPVLTTCFGGRLLLIHRNLHNGESVELDFYSVYIIMETRDKKLTELGI